MTPSSVCLDTDIGPLWYPEGDGGVTAFVSSNGFWEPEESEQIRKYLKSGDIFIDVGAHIGYFSVMAAQIVGDKGQVHSIEPEFDNASLLARNLEGFNNCIMYQAAAWRCKGKLDFYRSSVNSGDNRLYHHEESLDKVLVPGFPLDDLNLPRVDLIKVDTQGSDHYVLEGARNLIESNHPPIIVEWWPEGITARGDDQTKVLLGYTDLGYKIVPLTTNGTLPSDGYCSILLEPVNG